MVGQRFVVTGGLGFIGSHIVDLLLATGNLVWIIDNESTGHNHNNHDNCTTIIGDITVQEDMELLPQENIDGVIHLAACVSVAESMENPEKYKINNQEGSKLVFDWAEKCHVPSVVCASSAALYGNPKSLPLSETSDLQFLSPYAETKRAMEIDAIATTKRSGSRTRVTAMRFFNVYGPRQDPTSMYSGVISHFLRQSTGNEDVTIFGDGSFTRDFIYVGDIARAALKILNCPNPKHEVYNIATGQEITINGLAESIVKVTGSSSAITHGPVRAGDVPFSRANVTRLNEDIGYTAQVTLDEGIAKTLEWYKSTI